VELAAGENRLIMKKSRLESLAIFGAIVFAWQRLGLKELIPAVITTTPGIGVTVKPTAAGRCPAGYILSSDRTRCIKL